MSIKECNIVVALTLLDVNKETLMMQTDVPMFLFKGTAP